mgnify:CR=1 FL=1
MGFITDIENMPNEYAYSKVFFERWYRPQYTTVIIAGDVTPGAGACRSWRSTGAAGRRGTDAAVTIPKEPAPPGPALRARALGERHAAVRDGRRFRPRPSSRRARTRPAMDILGALYFGPTSELHKRLVVTEQKVDQLDVDVPANVDPSLFTVLARVKNPADAVDVRDQILATIAAAPDDAGACVSGWRMRSRSIDTHSRGRSTAPSASPPWCRSSPSYQAFV